MFYYEAILVYEECAIVRNGKNGGDEWKLHYIDGLGNVAII